MSKTNNTLFIILQNTRNNRNIRKGSLQNQPMNTNHF